MIIKYLEYSGLKHCGFLCAALLFLLFSLMHACRPRLVLSGSLQRSAPKPEGLLVIKPQGGQENRKFFSSSSSSLIQDSNRKKRKSSN